MPTARTTPTGTPMPEGIKSTITFEDDADIQLWEVEVQPPGLELGEKIDQTTMFNATYMTAEPRKLVEITDGQMVCAWEPAVYDQIITLMTTGRNQLITYTFPDTDTLDVRGWLASFVPQNLVIGARPLATVVIKHGNESDAGAETAPVFAGSGTD